MSRNFTVLLIFIVGIIGITFFYLVNINQSTAFLNSWEKAIPNQEIPKGLTSLTSKECGSCHISHYDEWKSSTHAMAWKDPQFQAEIAKESSPYMCINCHIPLQNQQKYIVTGLEDNDVYRPIKKLNPNFDVELQQEGINCASCHVRDGAIISMNVSNRAPHKSVQDQTHLSEQLCISCHNAVAVITPELVCTFETGNEWISGPFYETHNCKTCHMPEMERVLAKGANISKSRAHYFMGSGIPKHDTLVVERLDGLNFSFDNFSEAYNSEDSIILGTTIKNMFAGHRVPTGDPERFILTELSVLDLNDGYTVAIDSFRIGEHWEWYPEAKKISDNNLNPSESRQYQIKLKLEKGAYEFVVNSFKFRTTNEMVIYNGLSDSYPTNIMFFEKRLRFEVY